MPDLTFIDDPVVLPLTEDPSDRSYRLAVERTRSDGRTIRVVRHIPMDEIAFAGDGEKVRRLFDVYLQSAVIQLNVYLADGCLCEYPKEVQRERCPVHDREPEEEEDKEHADGTLTE